MSSPGSRTAINKKSSVKTHPALLYGIYIIVEQSGPKV